ncbi:MAG: hypothetical protein E6K94_05245 [Thaumarchaeota archaeon]|nr:MAG: hypothetical protein E6K94_05245 [Nitrososphaerota archaeon]
MKIISNKITLSEKSKGNTIGKRINWSFICVYLLILAIGLSILLFCWSPIPIAFSQLSSPGLNSSFSENALRINISNPSQIIHELVGKYITIYANLNYLKTDKTSDNSSIGGIAYISIVDIKDRVPVDLEDWSVEKGLYIPSISPGQSLPLEWNVRLVKAGSYTISVLFNENRNPFSSPIVSSRINLEVAPKLNLNPGNVLPVAFGVPAVLIGIFGTLNYLRGRKTGVYK